MGQYTIFLKNHTKISLEVNFGENEFLVAIKKSEVGQAELAEVRLTSPQFFEFR